MKKIIFTLLALVATLSINAQGIKIYDNKGNLVAVYKNSSDTNYKAVITKNTDTSKDYVDLGLSVLWATSNLGADSPEDYGSYCAWADIELYESGHSFDYPNLSYCHASTYTGPYTKYVVNDKYGTVDNKTTLDLGDDAANYTWGDNWRMPTYQEIQELASGTVNGWIDNYKGTGVAGYIFYKKVDGRDPDSEKGINAYGYNDVHIFLPAAGEYDETELKYAGKAGFYWSNSLTSGITLSAYIIEFETSTASDKLLGSRARKYGNTIRAVRSK